MTRLYVSGPITGLPDLNKPMFAAATEQLRAAGFEVLNPHDVCTDVTDHDCLGPCTPSEMMLPWADYLRGDLIAMLRYTDGVALLPGWENSRGAKLEVHVARTLGWEVKLWENWLVNP